MKRIGVLGAGIQGTCVALELAQRGYQVDLLDKNKLAITQASLQNEGKIHLGFVYANDPSLRTASRMLEGSLRFAALLNRWCDFGDLHDQLSTPFFYAVHAQSLLPPAQIERHFVAVGDLYAEMTKSGVPAYLGLPDTFLFDQLSCREAREIFGSPDVVAAYRTVEYAVDPLWVAQRLREALLGDPRITWCGQTVVDSASLGDDGRVHVTFRRNGEAGRESYDHVVNCLWDGRLKVDDSFGLRSSGDWLYRFKLAITVELAQPKDSLASTTTLLGPFGDVVNFPNAGKVYLSWYPHCMLATAQHPPPHGWRPDENGLEAAGITPLTLAALARIHAGLRTVSSEEIRAERIGGGVICAHGRTDITDPASGLHNRFDIGVRSHGSYHSVDTGKYCMAPYFAEQVGRRIAGED
jgi:hypothetical protein